MKQKFFLLIIFLGKLSSMHAMAPERDSDLHLVNITGHPLDYEVSYNALIPFVLKRKADSGHLEDKAIATISTGGFSTRLMVAHVILSDGTRIPSLGFKGANYRGYFFIREQPNNKDRFFIDGPKSGPPF